MSHSRILHAKSNRIGDFLFLNLRLVCFFKLRVQTFPQVFSIKLATYLEEMFTLKQRHVD